MIRQLSVVPTVAPSTPSSSTWLDFLDAAMLSVWRPDEWDVEAMTFVGDPRNPLTGLSFCATEACRAVVDGPSIGRCLACRKRLSRWFETDGDFDHVYRPRYRRGGTSASSFTLAHLNRGVRNEIIYGLQQRDLEGIGIRPTAVAGMIRVLGSLDSVLDAKDEGTKLQISYIRGVQRHVRRLRAAHAGRDGTEGEVWDCALVGLHSARDRKYRAFTGHLDFTVVRQMWLRNMTLGWARALRPAVSEVRHTLRAVEIASLALAGRPRGDEPGQLGLPDMSVVFEGFVTARSPRSGELYSLSQRHSLIGRWRRLIQFGRTAGLMDEVPGAFALLPDRNLPSMRSQEGELGRAIPESWIAHLDVHLSLLGSTSSFRNNGWSAADYAAQYQAVYALIRDTGRRPSEILSLKRDSIEYYGEDPALIYDNRKAGRLGRRLPVDPSTAKIIQDWTSRLATLPLPLECGDYLFPAPGARNRERRGHMSANQFARVFRSWVDSVPQPRDLPPDAARFSHRELEPYGLRHAYAQRHADNGTNVDVLSELMDHVDLGTTMGYYKVSLKRKQEAVRLLSKYVTDRFGQPAPFESAVAYERSSVAVPFGNCTEPKNVQAGGKACPIRFQCAGCGYFRPDPSYLEALDNHVAQLRVDKELAIASDTADWVISNLDEQITAFSDIASSLRSMIEALPVVEQEALSAASTAINRERTATAFIPLSAIGVRSDGR